MTKQLHCHLYILSAHAYAGRYWLIDSQSLQTPISKSTRECDCCRHQTEVFPLCAKWLSHGARWNKVQNNLVAWLFALESPFRTSPYLRKWPGRSRLSSLSGLETRERERAVCLARSLGGSSFLKYSRRPPLCVHVQDLAAKEFFVESSTQCWHGWVLVNLRWARLFVSMNGCLTEGADIMWRPTPVLNM